MKILLIFGILFSCCPSIKAEKSFESLLSHSAGRRKRSPEDTASILSRVNFDCWGKRVGYYADEAFGCSIFHFCDKEGRRFSYRCSNDKKFDQNTNTCTLDYLPNCQTTESSPKEFQATGRTFQNIGFRDKTETKKDKGGRSHFQNDFSPDSSQLETTLRESQSSKRTVTKSPKSGSGIDALSAFAALAQNNNLDFKEDPGTEHSRKDKQIDRVFYNERPHFEHPPSRTRIQNPVFPPPRFPPHPLRRHSFSDLPRIPPEHHHLNVPLLNPHHLDPFERVHRPSLFVNHQNVFTPSPINRNFHPSNFNDERDFHPVQHQQTTQIRHPLPARSHFSFTPPGSPAPVTHQTIAHDLPDYGEPEFQNPVTHRFFPFASTPNPLPIQPNIDFHDPPNRHFVETHVPGGRFSHGDSTHPNHFLEPENHFHKSELPRRSPHQTSSVVRDSSHRPNIGDLHSRGNPNVHFLHDGGLHDDDYYYYEYGDLDESDYDYGDYELNHEPEVKKPHQSVDAAKQESPINQNTKPEIILNTKTDISFEKPHRIPFKSKQPPPKKNQKLPEVTRVKEETTLHIEEEIKPTTIRPEIRRPIRIPFSTKKRTSTRNNASKKEAPKPTSRTVVKETKKSDLISNKQSPSPRDQLKDKLKRVAQERRLVRLRQSEGEKESKAKEITQDRNPTQSDKPAKPTRITNFFKPKFPNRRDQVLRRRLPSRKRKQEEPKQEPIDAQEAEKSSKSIDDNVESKKDNMEGKNAEQEAKDEAKKEKELDEESVKEPGTDARAKRPKNPNVRAKFNEFLKNRKNRLASLRIPLRRGQRKENKGDKDSKKDDSTKEASAQTSETNATPTTQNPSLEEEVRKKRLSNDLDYSSSIRVPKKKIAKISPTKTLRYLLNRNNDNSFSSSSIANDKKEENDVTIKKHGELKKKMNKNSNMETQRKTSSKITNHRIISKPNFKQFVRMSPNIPLESKGEMSEVITAPTQDFTVKVSSSYNNKGSTIEFPKTTIENSLPTPQVIPKKKLHESSTESSSDYTSLIDKATSFEMNRLPTIKPTTPMSTMEEVKLKSRPVFDLDSVYRKSEQDGRRFISASDTRGVAREEKSNIEFLPFLIPNDRPLLPIEKLMKIT